MPSRIKYLLLLITVTLCHHLSAQQTFVEKLDSLYYLAQQHYQNQQYPQAIQAQAQVVQMLEGTEYFDAYVAQLSMLGSMHEANQNPAQAIEIHSKVVTAIEQQYGPIEMLGTPYTNLILNYIATAQYQQAKDTYKKFDTLYNNLPQIEDVETYLYLAANIREKLQMKYVYSEAELGIAQQEITTCGNYYGTQSPKYGQVAAYIGNLFIFLGEFETGTPYLIQAVAAYKANKYQYPDEYLKALKDLADAYIAVEDHTNAQTIVDTELEFAQSTYGNNQPETAAPYYQLSRINTILGNYAQAEENGMAAIAIIENSQATQNAEYIQYLTNIGSLYTQLGHIQKALYYYTLAHQYTQDFEGHSPTKAYGLAITRLQLASLFIQVDMYDTAKQNILSAIQLLDENWGQENPHSPQGYMVLADLYNSTNMTDSAIWCLKKVNTVLQKIYTPQQFAYTQVYDNLRGIYYLQGKHDSAALMAQKSLTLAENTVGKKHNAYRNFLKQTTQAYIKTNQPQAPQYIQQLITTDRQELRSKLTFLSGDELMGYINTQTAESHHMLAYATAQNPKKFAGELLNNMLLLQGASLRYSNNILASIKKSGNEELLTMYNKLSQLRAALAKEYSQPQRNPATFVWEVEADELEKQLVKKSAAYRDIDQLFTADWKEIQKQLQPTEAAIQFISYDMMAVNETDSIQYAAIVLRPKDKQPHFIPLFNQNRLQNILSSVAPKQMFGTRSSELLQENTINPAAYGDSLYQTIWQPLEQYIAPYNTLYISADGLLHQVAFNALPVNDSSLLIDKYKIVQLLTLKNIQTPPAPKQQTTAVLFGGINYNPQTTDTTAATFSLLPEDRGTTTSFGYLQGTLAETQQIQHLFQTIKANAVLYTANQATEEQFKKLSGQAPKVLHMATHGFFIQEAQENKKIGHKGQNQNVFTLANNPLMRGGLLLAGGNAAWQGKATPKGQEDGVLTAYEVASLDLSNTQLVVLSACQTGLGQNRGTEGVFGLQRAFKMAGANTLLMSLWSVPDKETKELMQHFYSQYVLTGNARTAFEAAQKTMRAQYPPYYWAAFVLVE